MVVALAFRISGCFVVLLLGVRRMLFCPMLFDVWFIFELSECRLLFVVCSGLLVWCLSVCLSVCCVILHHDAYPRDM